MKVITYGNDLLRQKAEKIEKIDADIRELAKQMFVTLKEDKGVGLAAPQIGIKKRIFVVHIEDDEQRVFINPSILETSHETANIEEGCLSFPGVYAKVIRPESIKMQAWNEKGRPFTIEASGLLARVLLHEYDHLEGLMFFDHLPQQKKTRLIEKYEKTEKKSALRPDRAAAEN